MVENYWKKIGGESLFAHLRKAIWMTGFESNDPWQRNGFSGGLVWFIGKLCTSTKKYTHVSIYACLRFSLGFYYAYQINNGEIVKKKIYWIKCEKSSILIDFLVYKLDLFWNHGVLRHSRNFCCFASKLSKSNLLKLFCLFL